MADKNMANGIRSETAPTNVVSTEQITPTPGVRISGQEELEQYGQQMGAETENYIRRTTGDNIYYQDIEAEKKAIQKYSELYGKPKTDQEWRAFHDYVYEPESSEKNKEEMEDLAELGEAESEIKQEEEKMTDEEREANKQRQIAEGVAEGEEEYVEEDTTPTVEEQLISIQDDMDTEFQAYMDQFNLYTNSLAADNIAAIQNIKDAFDRRREQTKQINKAVLGAKKLLGARSGRQRYAAEIQSSIISTEEQAGISRLADLDAQEQTLVMQAQQAQTEKQWSAYNQLFTKIQENQEQKRQTIFDLNSIAMAQEELALDKLKEAQDQQMEMLNYNLQAERVGMEYSRLDREQANQEVAQLAESGFTPGQFTEEEKAEYEQRLGLPDGTFEGFMGQLNSANIQKQLGDEIAFNNDLMGLLDKVPGDSMINIGGNLYQGTKQDDMYVVRETDAYGNVTVMGINEQTGEVKYAESLGRIGKGLAKISGIPGSPTNGEEATFLGSLASQAIDLENSLPNDDSRRRAWDELMASAAASEDVPYSAETLSQLVSGEMSRIKSEGGITTQADIERKASDVLGGGEEEEKKVEIVDNEAKTMAYKLGEKTKNLEISKLPGTVISKAILETTQPIYNFIQGKLGREEQITEKELDEIYNMLGIKSIFKEG